MQELTVKINIEIAGEIQNVRFLADEVRDAETDIAGFEDVDTSDGRTRIGKAYRAAMKRWNRSVQDYRHSAERLGYLIADEVKQTNQELHAYIEREVVG